MKEYTAEEAKLRSAIHAVAKQAAGDLLQVISARVWTRRHPWVAAAAGIAGGIVAGEACGGIIPRDAAPLRSRSAPRAVWATGVLSHTAHSLVALVVVAFRTAVKMLFRVLVRPATRLENWFPSG